MSRFVASEVRVVAADLRFPEGPVAFADGTVLVSEIEGGSVACIAPDGTVRRVDVGGGANGAAVGPDGAVYVCNDGGLEFTTEDGIRFPFEVAAGNEGGALQRVELDTGHVTTVFTHSGDARLGNLNDIVFDAGGRCYIVDTTRGAIHRADPLAGTIGVADDSLEFPNGAGLSPDGSQLFVSETYSGRIVRFDVGHDGDLTGKTVIHDNAGAHRWDGLAVDGAGHVCISNQEQSGITVMDGDGHVVDAFTTPAYDPYVTNLCFGGPDGATAYVCSSGRGVLYAVAWPWPGLRLDFAR